MVAKNTIDAAIIKARIQYRGIFSQFSLLWGSVDAYNTLEFWNGLTKVGSITGDSIIQNNFGLQTSGGSAFVSFDEYQFDKVVFFSGQKAFEVDNVSVGGSVPDGGATIALLGLATTAMGLFRRKFQRADA